MIKIATLRKPILIIGLLLTTIISQSQNCEITSFWGLPDELNRGRFKADGQLYGHPYTIFNKRDFGGVAFDLKKEIDHIRNKIIADSNTNKQILFSTYRTIFRNANGQIPAEVAPGVEVSNLAKWAKYNAFILLVGLDENCEDLRNTKKDSILANIEYAFEHMKYGTTDEQGVLNLAQTTVLWMQAYDLYKCFYKLKGKMPVNVSFEFPFAPAIHFFKTEKAYCEDIDRNDYECSPRNKMRMLARELWWSCMGSPYNPLSFGPVNHPTGWKKNHGIIGASAMLLSSIVLNDAGCNAVNWTWKPGNWAEDANEGIEDCFFDGYHPFTINVPTTSEDGLAGYNEGPNYWSYTLGTLAPAMIASNNMYPSNSTNNWFTDARIKNIMEWYDKIRANNNWVPTYDNSRNIQDNVQGLLNNQYDLQTLQGMGNLLPDYIVAVCQRMQINKLPPTNKVQDPFYNSDKSGNIILRMQNDTTKHYFHMLYETGDAIAKEAYVNLPYFGDEGSHEDKDMGSFLIQADDYFLAIDPPYFGSADSYRMNKFKMHNVIEFAKLNEGAGDVSAPIISDKFVGDNMLGFTLNIPLADDNSVKRKVQMVNSNGIVYYLLNDYVIATDDNPYNNISFKLNGNGFSIDSTFEQLDANGNPDLNGHIFKWTHPCRNLNSGTGWNMLAHSAVLNAPNRTTTFSESYSDAEHGGLGHPSGNENLYICKQKSTSSDGSPIGEHSRMLVTQVADTTIFQTFILPYKCNMQTSLPTIHKEETTGRVSTIIRFIVPRDTSIIYRAKGSTPITGSGFINDTIYDHHVSQMSSAAIDVADPFKRGEVYDTLRTDALSAFASRSTLEILRNDFCSPSFIKLKSCAISNGSFLTFKDTNYIESSVSMSAIEYHYVSKFRYEGYCSGVGSVIFCLPSLIYGYPMKATGAGVVSYVHNDTSNYKFISVTFSGPGKFVLELKDPCSDDCYFPPTDMTIDSVFNFNLGLTKTLSHDLDIISPDGLLNITNQSQMSICPDNTLVNKSRIVMQMSCAPLRQWIIHENGTKEELPRDTFQFLCNRNELLKDRAENNIRNIIIVNNKAALVLDSGSVTHIGNNSTIIIRSGGTLLIKAGAKVIIGDSDCVENRGELLADHDSYVCIEEGADIHFYNDIDSFNFYYKDTIDRHIVYIAMPNSYGGGAFAGKNPLGGRGKFIIADEGGDSGIWMAGVCVPFCELKSKNPPHGINNRSFGWCNIGEPRAYFTSPDTLCIGKPFSINATRSLNETGYIITACKFDTLTQTCIGLVDSVVDDGDLCLSYRYLFTPMESGYYRVRLIVKNDCNLTDTFTKIVYVPNLPLAKFTIQDSICPGYGTLLANGSMSISNINACKHRWSIEPIPNDSIIIGSTLGEYRKRDWVIDSLTTVDSNFNFPGYNFTGGIRYLVSLTVWGWCSDSTVWDTVSVPLKVTIDMEAASTVYSNPTGPAAIQLKGVVLNATSWSWDPTTYLDTPTILNPVATPPDSIQYILTGTRGACSISDTVTIRHNTLTYAGVDRSVCFNQSTVLGTDYHAAAFLGLMYSLKGNDFYLAYEGCREDNTSSSSGGNPIDVQKYLTEYLIERGITNSLPYAIEQLWVNHPEIRNAIINDVNYSNYFESFITANGDETALSGFQYIIDNNSSLETAVNALDFDKDYLTELAAFFEDYETWYTAKVYNMTYLDIIWEKKTDTTWNELSAWRAHFNADVDTTQSATYRITLIDSYNSLVEYDEVTVLIDTALIPRYEVAYQVDSTLYFTNMSTPNPFNTYDWNFGDGSAHATQRHPVHTFAAFDSAYVVCLSVTNACSTYTYCDTIHVDSSGLLNNGFIGNRNTENKLSEQSSVVSAMAAQSKTQAVLVKNEVTLQNIPNPFTENTTLSYAIGKPFKQAELRVTDVLGRTLKAYPVRSLKGEAMFEGSKYDGGVYYAVLIVDGIVVRSKTMIIEK